MRKSPTYTVIRAPRLLGTPEYVQVKEFALSAYIWVSFWKFMLVKFSENESAELVYLHII